MQVSRENRSLDAGDRGCTVAPVRAPAGAGELSQDSSVPAGALAVPWRAPGCAAAPCPQTPHTGQAGGSA